VSKKEHNSGHGRLAIFTVCADSDLSSLVMSAAAYVPGSDFAGAFEEYITAERRPHFPPSMKQAHSCVAFIDFDVNPEYAIETAEALRSNPSSSIIPVGVGSMVDADLLLRAMRAGCSEFLQKPLQTIHLQETLERIQNRILASTATSGRRGQVVAFLGAKGGVGTTVLAVHVGVALAAMPGKKTLLIDHHHRLGHVCLYLGIKESHYHFDELILNVQRLDADLLKGFVIRHASGLEVIASPDGYAPRYHGSGEEMEQVLDFLREEYDFILIDSSIAYDQIVGAVIRLADEVALISTPDVAALRDLSRHIEHLNLSEVAAAKLRIIINRDSANGTVTPEQVAKAVRLPVSNTIPNQHSELLRAINEGEPLSSQRRSEFSAQIGKWADRLAHLDEDAGAPAARKKFAFWR
jgi:pilus assembly protein CpaE